MTREMPPTRTNDRPERGTLSLSEQIASERLDRTLRRVRAVQKSAGGLKHIGDSGGQ
jgi:hypothetical protein